MQFEMRARLATNPPAGGAGANGARNEEGRRLCSPIMEFVQILWYYIIWHYTKAWSDMARVIGNYLWFMGNFFSIGLLAKSLFSPWRRLSVSGGRGREESFFGAIIINTLMRFVGFGIRAITIMAGVVAIFITIVVTCFAVLLWLVFPAVVFLLFFAGLGYLIKII